MKRSLDDLLEEYQVEDPTMTHDDRDEDISTWYGVSNNDGIIAYFGYESDALAFRLFMINSILNRRNV